MCIEGTLEICPDILCIIFFPHYRWQVLPTGSSSPKRLAVSLSYTSSFLCGKQVFALVRPAAVVVVIFFYISFLKIASDGPFFSFNVDFSLVLFHSYLRLTLYVKFRGVLKYTTVAST